MSETVEKKAMKPLGPGSKYPAELKKDCLALYIKGFQSRQVRRILTVKYDTVPPANTIRRWSADYGREIKEAVAKSHDMDVLVALEAELENVEDISDDILKFAVPAVLEGGEKEFKKLPYRDQITITLKEIDSKAQRAERKIARIDGTVGANSPILIFQNVAKQAAAQKAADGITAPENIVDADIIEG